MDEACSGRAPALREQGAHGAGQAAPLAALLAQVCRTVLDGQVDAMAAGLAYAARNLLTSGDEGRPQPVAQIAAVAGPVRNRHIALADLCGWPLYSVESALITVHLTTPTAGVDGVLHSPFAATAAAATMTVTFRLATRPGPRPLTDDLVAAALTPTPPTTDSDRFPAPARRAIGAWRHLPHLYRLAEQLAAQAPDHPATPRAVRAVEDLAAAVCRWCAGGPPVGTRLIEQAPQPGSLDPDAPPALSALADQVSKLRGALSAPERV
ncbi:hypothetical protein ACIQVT_22075 [Streptomyces sp. NPDC100445]|uniref:hypothetical protein n=1 Tax=Streptomyces sp. NPDC100445 TaxID=3366102 RepID=UPI00382C0518